MIETVQKNEYADCPVKCAELPHHVDVRYYAIYHGWIMWCQDNCKARWGWYFKGKRPTRWEMHNHYEGQDAFMAFEDRNEALLFKLTFIGVN